LPVPEIVQIKKYKDEVDTILSQASNIPWRFIREILTQLQAIGYIPHADIHEDVIDTVIFQIETSW